MTVRMIYLMRHGKVQLADGERRYIGHTDIPLSPEGIDQARQLGGILSGLDIAGLYCSDLTRSRETVRQITAALALEPVARQDLREINMGDWDGLTLNEVAIRYPEEYAERGADFANYRISGGESFAECGRRALNALEEILASSAGNIAIVAHAGFNRTLLCQLLGLPFANMFNIPQDYCCINIISYAKRICRIKTINYTVNCFRR